MASLRRGPRRTNVSSVLPTPYWITKPNYDAARSKIRAASGARLIYCAGQMSLNGVTKSSMYGGAPVPTV